MKWSTNSWHTSRLPTSSGCRQRDESQPAIAGYEKFCEMATLLTCILRWALFYFCIHPPFFCLLLQSSFLPPKYTFEVLFPLWKMWACNTLLWLSGRRVVIAVVVIVPFSIHFRASFWGAAAILHVCIFLCIRTFLWERRKKVGHVLFMHLGFLSFGRVVRSLSFPDPYIGLGQLQNGCC